LIKILVQTLTGTLIGLGIGLGAIYPSKAQQFPGVPKLPSRTPAVIPTPTVTPTVTPTLAPLPPPPLPGLKGYGYQIFLNGRTLSAAWIQRPTKSGKVTTHINDGALRQLMGIDLLNSNNPNRQPISWYAPVGRSLTLSALLANSYRYLDITEFAKTAGWQIQVNGNILVINTPATKITEILEARPQGLGTQATIGLRVNLEHAAPWQVSQGQVLKSTQPVDPDAISSQTVTPPHREWLITIDGIADPGIVQRYTPAPLPPVNPTPTPAPFPNLLKQLPIPAPLPNQIPPNQIPVPSLRPEPLVTKVEVVNNQTIIGLSIPFGYAPRITSQQNPNSLNIEIRSDALVTRDITWAPGVRWRQQLVSAAAGERFPVVWLEINPRTTGLKIRPIVSNADTLVGTAALVQTAPKYFAVAAINAGFFNRNNRLPLGAIKRNGQWLSSPILNRGAIAWNDSGQFYLGRLTVEESLITSNNQKFPILSFNSGYVQSGMARYTPVWGTSYTPLTDNEIVLVVQGNQIINQLQAGFAGSTPIPIPSDGYILTMRGNAKAMANQLPIGTVIRIETNSLPMDFNRYPQVIAAGPLLIQNRQIVLDGAAEKFGNAFVEEKAVRSAICTTATGSLIIAAVHNRPGGAGPTLGEQAQLMQQMGCTNALNLDGGSSTSLYLGGQLLDRSPSSAARVHNGIGIFLQQK
jgi:exopolysaccharide biosynthesis protein